MPKFQTGALIASSSTYKLMCYRAVAYDRLRPSFEYYSDESYSYDEYIQEGRKIEFVPSNIKYALKHQAGREQSAPNELPFSPDELDQIDALGEQAVLANQPKKQSLVAKIAASHESLKKRFMRALDATYEPIFGLGERYSEYSMFELACGDFQDKKNDFEMENSPQTHAALYQSLANLLCFSQAKRLYAFVDENSIGSILGKCEQLFAGFFSGLEGSLHEFDDLNGQVDSLCVDADDFLKYYKAEVSAESKAKPKPADASEKKAESFTAELEAFRAKLAHSFEQKNPKPSQSVVKPEKELQTQFSKFINRSEFELPERKSRCFGMNRDSTRLLFEANCSSGTTKLFTADITSPELEYECVLQFDGRVEGLWVSPCNQFVAIRAKQGKGTRLYQFGRSGSSRLFRVGWLSQVSIQDFVFVDAPETTKLACADSRGRLCVYDLATGELEFTMGGQLQVKSLVYVDQAHVLVRTTRDEFGLFSLETWSLASLAQLPEFEEDRMDFRDKSESA